MRGPDRSPGTLLEIARATRARSIRRPIASFRRRLVAARRHLPDLPTQLRRLGWQRGRRPAGDHRPPRPPGPGRARRRRDLAVADLPVAGPRPWLRRQRPRQRRPALRLRGRFRPARRGGAPTGHPGRPRPGHEPHQPDEHPWFAASRASGPARSPTGTCGATLPERGPTALRCRPTTGCRSSAARAGQWEPAREQFYFHTFLVEQPELNWRAPGVEEAQFAMVRGWLERGVDGFRLDVFNAFLKDPELPLEPDPRRARRHGIARSTGTTATSPISRRSSAASARSSTSSPAGCPSASCSTAWSRRPPGWRSIGHLVFDWELVEARVERAGACAPRSPGARRPSARTAGRRRCCPTTTSRATRRGSPASAGAADVDAVARAAAVLLLTLRGTPFLYYGEELGLGDVDVPAIESVDPPAAARRARLHLVGPLAQPDPDALDDRARARGSRPAGRGSGSVPTRRSRNVAVQAADPGLDAVALSPTDRAPGEQPGAPGRVAPARPARTGTSWPTPARPRASDPAGRAQPRPRAGRLAPRRTARRRPAGGSLLGDRRRIAGRRRDAMPAPVLEIWTRRGRHPRAIGLISRSVRPCYHDGRSTPSQRPGSRTCRLNS